MSSSTRRLPLLVASRSRLIASLLSRVARLTALIGAFLSPWLVLASPVHAAEIPGAVIILETAPGAPGSEPAGAPPRFVLMKDGQVFVGGTAHLQAGHVDKTEASALRRGADAARKAAGKSSQLTFGGDAARAIRLRFPEDGPTDLEIRGDPAQAPTPLQPVAIFVRELLDYYNPALVPYRPTSYALRARAGARPGGCRGWTFSFPIEQVLEAPRVVPATDAASWPTGAEPASVCVGGKRYVVTLRPLVPGEQP